MSSLLVAAILAVAALVLTRGEDGRRTARKTQTTAPAKPVSGAAAAPCAVSPSIESGDIYRVRNVTADTAFRDRTHARPGDELLFRARIATGGPCEGVRNVTAQAVFGEPKHTNVSTLILKSPNSQPTNAADTATVIVEPTRDLEYVPRSTSVETIYGEDRRQLPDGLVRRGITVGDVGLNVAATLIVEFQMRVSVRPPL